MMNNFYEILEIIYQINKKCPELRFGQIVGCIYNKNIEDLFYISDEELLIRLKELLEDSK